MWRHFTLSIRIPLGTEVCLSLDDIVRRGPSHPSPKRGGAPSPIFSPLLLWPNGWMHQDVTWYGGRPQPRRLCARRRPKKGAEPPICAHVYCGQTAGWIKMPLGTEVGLGPNDIVTWGSWGPRSPPSKSDCLHLVIVKELNVYSLIHCVSDGLRVT